MNHHFDIRGRLVLAGTIGATLSVMVILAGCCLSSPDRTVFFCLYQFCGTDRYGPVLWPILIAASVLIALGICKLLRDGRQEPEAIGVRLLPGLIGAILSTAFALMMTPAGSFLLLAHPGAEVSKMAWLTLLVLGLLFLGISVSWLLIQARRNPRSVGLTCRVDISPCR